MKRTISLFISVLVATTTPSIAASDRDQVIDREQAAWQAYKDKKADQFRKMLSDNYRAAYPDGIYTLGGEMKSLQESEIKSFSLSRFDIVPADSDTVVVTYSATMQGTNAGKDMSGTYNATSVWQKHGDNWQVVFHTHVLEEKSK